ncbi:MAG: CHASE domain-containing protein, partial [Pseudohongiellaceae bacterium]
MRSSRSVKSILRNLRIWTQVASLYYCLAQLGFLFATPGTNITLLWLPSGLAMAAIVKCGLRGAIGIFTGALLANLFSLQPDSADIKFHIALLISASNTFGSLLSGILYLRYATERNTANQLVNIRRFFIIACLSHLPVAVIGSYLMSTHDSGIELSFPITDALKWWLGDSLGILIGFPILIHLSIKTLDLTTQKYPVANLWVLSIGILLSVLLYLQILHRQYENVALRFEYESNFSTFNFDTQLIQLLQHQIEIADKLSKTIPVNKESFESAVYVELYSEYAVPGINSISWNKLVSDADRLAFEQKMRAEGYEGYSIRSVAPDGNLQSAPRQDQYLAIQYISPSAENESALGFDIYSDNSRKMTAEAAMNYGKSLVTPPIELVQLSGQSNPLGALMMLPVRAESGTASPLIEGLVVFVVQYESIFKIIADVNQNQNVAIFDITDPGAEINIFNSSGDFPDLDYKGMVNNSRQFNSAKVTDFGGRQLLINTWPDDITIASYLGHQPLYFLFSALTISLL